MAIRFQCAACSEPIEVDDQWARQVVRCPYCQRTVTAPGESTLPTGDLIPVASAVAARREAVPQDPVGAAGACPGYAPAPQTNRAAVTALVLVLASLALLLAAMGVVSQHTPEMEELSRIIQDASKKSGSPVGAMLKYMEEHGGRPPRWMATFIVLELSSMAAWLGTIVFGIVGLARPVRRGMAVAALVIAGLLGLLFCVSAAGSL